MYKPSFMPHPFARISMAGLLCCLGASALAQSIQIQIPRMTERSATGTQPAGQAQPSAYGSQGTQVAQGAQQSAYGSTAQQSAYGTTAQQQAYGTGAQPAYGSQPAAYGSQTSAYGSQPSAYGSGSSAYGGTTAGYGSQHSSGGGGAISGPAPTKPTSGGPCKVTVSPERQSLTLVGATDNLPRTNVPLGDFRAQTVIHAPDGRWAVAFLKLRGQSQFAMFTMDLTQCKEGHTVDLAQAGEDATFEGDNVTVRTGGKTQQWPLANPRMR